jgi:hypothetical protein
MARQLLSAKPSAASLNGRTPVTTSASIPVSITISAPIRSWSNPTRTNTRTARVNQKFHPGRNCSSGIRLEGGEADCEEGGEPGVGR